MERYQTRETMPENGQQIYLQKRFNTNYILLPRSLFLAQKGGRLKRSTRFRGHKLGDGSLLFI